MELCVQGDNSGIGFKLHDFGARGVISMESAMLGGMAHVVNFQGTDTLSAVLGARAFYGEPMAGFSIPAAEHSTITCWGQDGEADAHRNMLARYAKPGALLAVVHTEHISCPLFPHRQNYAQTDNRSQSGCRRQRFEIHWLAVVGRWPNQQLSRLG